MIWLHATENMALADFSNGACIERLSDSQKEEQLGSWPRQYCQVGAEVWLPFYGRGSLVRTMLDGW